MARQASQARRSKARMAKYLLGEHMEYHLRWHVQHNDLLGASLDRPECHVPVPGTQERTEVSPTKTVAGKRREEGLLPVRGLNILKADRHDGASPATQSW